MTRVSLSATTRWRLPVGVWDCSFAGECSEVCPKHVDPAAALQQLKIATTVQWYKGLIGMGGK